MVSLSNHAAILLRWRSWPDEIAALGPTLLWLGLPAIPGANAQPIGRRVRRGQNLYFLKKSDYFAFAKTGSGRNPFVKFAVTLGRVIQAWATHVLTDSDFMMGK